MAIFPTYKAPVNKNINNTNKNQQSIIVPSVSACKPIYDNQAQIDSLNSILANFNMLKAANSFVQCDQKFIDQVTTALKNAIANGNIIGNTCETSTPQPSGLTITLPPPPIRANISSTNGVNPVNPPSEKLADCIAKANATLNSDLDAILGLWNRGEINDSQKTYLVNRAQTAHDSACGGAAKGSITLLTGLQNSLLKGSNSISRSNPNPLSKACVQAEDDYIANIKGINDRYANGELNAAQRDDYITMAKAQLDRACAGTKKGGTAFILNQMNNY